MVTGATAVGCGAGAAFDAAAVVGFALGAAAWVGAALELAGVELVLALLELLLGDDEEQAARATAAPLPRSVVKNPRRLKTPGIRDLVGITQFLLADNAVWTELGSLYGGGRARVNNPKCLIMHLTEAGNVASEEVLPKGGGKVTRESIWEYAEAVRPRYRRAGKEERGRILAEFCETIGYHRKSAVRLLSRRIARPVGRRGRTAVYGAAVADALRRVRAADPPREPGVALRDA